MKALLKETAFLKRTFNNLRAGFLGQKQKAGILYEDNGIAKVTGIITDIFEKGGKHWIRMNNKLDIQIDKLVAVNGSFLSDYSEC